MEESLHAPDEPFDPLLQPGRNSKRVLWPSSSLLPCISMMHTCGREYLPPERQILLDRFKNYAVWHPRLVQVQTQVLDTIWEPADVVYVVVCGPSGVGKSKLAEVLARRLNTPKPGSNGQFTQRALLINTRPADGAL